MYLLITALKNIQRYAKRYCLFGALIFITLVITTISYAYTNVLDQHLTALIEQYGATVVIDEGVNSLSADDLEDIAAFPEVQEVCMQSFKIKFWSESVLFDGMPLHPEILQDKDTAAAVYKATRISAIGPNERNPEIWLYGEKADGDIWKQSALLTAGRCPVAEGEIMLADTFAELFLLSDVGLGSKITISIGWQTKEFTVVGLYDPVVVMSAEGQMQGNYCPFIALFEDVSYFDDADNIGQYYQQMMRIYCPDVTGIYYNQSAVNYDTYVLLKHSSMLEAFTERVETNYKNYRVRFYYEDAEKMINVYQWSRTSALQYQDKIIIIAAVVIVIMTALGTHERNYEIGVLLSVGMSKCRIAVLFVIENLMFILSISVLAYITGLVAAPMVATRFLDDAVTLSRSAAALPVAGTMLALAVGLSLPASLISALAILRFKPMTILRSRT